MKRNNLLFSVLVAILSLYTLQGFSQSASVVVIVNLENPVVSMNASQVKLTYLRKINKRWKELNKNIVPVDKKGDSEAKKKFLNAVLQMTPDEVSRYFTEREYQNAEAPPIKLMSDEEIISFVEDNIGAIGFVSKTSVKADSKIKVILSL